MGDFILGKDYFGYYTQIRTGFSEQLHTYKVVGAFESNTYCDTPIVASSVPVIHSEIVTCLNVIHCGVDESKVVRVAMKDAFFMKNETLTSLKAAKNDIAALLWLNGNCEYCKHGECLSYCGATQWHCLLGNGAECRPEWRGARKEEE